jgi:predicted RecA/RadA family phage recombinase
MSQTQLKSGGVFTFTAPRALTSGDPVLIGFLFGITQETVANGATNGEAVRIGVHTLPKKSGDTFTQGAKMYWDDTNHYITSAAASGANLLVALCETAQPTGAALTVRGVLLPLPT